MVLPFVRDLFVDLEKLPAFLRVASHLREGAGRIRISGLVPTAKALLLVLLQKAIERPLIIVVADNRAAEDLSRCCRHFASSTAPLKRTPLFTFPHVTFCRSRIFLLIRRSRKSARWRCGKLRRVLHPLWFHQSPPLRFACARQSTTPIWRAPYAVMKCSM